LLSPRSGRTVLTARFPFPKLGSVETQAGNSISCPFGDDSSYQVNVRVTDGDGGVATGFTTVTVNNVAPALTISGDASVNEGSTYTLNLASSDPGADTISGWTITWGDDIVETVSGNPALVTHVYTDGPAAPTISARATDEDGTYDANSISIAVNNVASTPSISGAPASSPEGTAINLSGGVRLGHRWVA